jgi:hypothetical protein
MIVFVVWDLGLFLAAALETVEAVAPLSSISRVPEVNPPSSRDKVVGGRTKHLVGRNSWVVVLSSVSVIAVCSTMLEPMSPHQNPSMLFDKMCNISSVKVVCPPPVARSPQCSPSGDHTAAQKFSVQSLGGQTLPRTACRRIQHIFSRGSIFVVLGNEMPSR